MYTFITVTEEISLTNDLNVACYLRWADAEVNANPLKR